LVRKKEKWSRQQLEGPRSKKSTKPWKRKMSLRGYQELAKGGSRRGKFRGQTAHGDNSRGCNASFGRTLARERMEKEKGDGGH